VVGTSVDLENGVQLPLSLQLSTAVLKIFPYLSKTPCIVINLVENV
jgi:hypothetical protein